MEFIKNIFKKIKDFFTIHKRVRLLEHKADHLEVVNKRLERQIMVLEFKSDAKDAKYLFNKIRPIIYSNVGPYYWAVAFINGDHVVSVLTEEKVGPYEPVINGDYIEFYRFGKVDTVYTTEEGGEDKLIPVDIELYKKAYPEKFENASVLVCNRDAENGAINDISCSRDSLAGAVAECTKAVTDLKKTLTKKNKTTKSLSEI